MKFRNFDLKNDNHFIAMQYYGLIVNRTYLVLITKDQIIGLKVNGLISVEGGGNAVARGISNTMAIKGDLQNPHSYIKARYMDRLMDLELVESEIKTNNKANFIIKQTDIKNIYHDPKKKWGMGYYPHDGKVYIVTNEGKKKELIILGSQSGNKIVSDIMKKAASFQK